MHLHFAVRGVEARIARHQFGYALQALFMEGYRRNRRSRSLGRWSYTS
jgi:hypothetical protein